jgi:hypothetical protein
VIPIVLLFCVLGVGVLGLVAAGLGLKKHLDRQRRTRARVVARVQAERVAREQPRNPPAVGLTGVIETLEESVRFARVPDTTPAPPPRRAPKGTVAPAPRIARSYPIATPHGEPSPASTAPPVWRPPRAPADPIVRPPTRRVATLPPPIPPPPRTRR